MFIYNCRRRLAIRETDGHTKPPRLSSVENLGGYYFSEGVYQFSISSKPWER